MGEWGGHSTPEAARPEDQDHLEQHMRATLPYGSPTDPASGMGTAGANQGVWSSHERNKEERAAPKDTCTVLFCLRQRSNPGLKRLGCPIPGSIPALAPSPLATCTPALPCLRVCATGRNKTAPHVPLHPYPTVEAALAQEESPFCRTLNGRYAVLCLREAELGWVRVMMGMGLGVVEVAGMEEGLAEARTDTRHLGSGELMHLPCRRGP